MCGRTSFPFIIAGPVAPTVPKFLNFASGLSHIVSGCPNKVGFAIENGTSFIASPMENYSGASKDAGSSGAARSLD